VTYLFMPLGYTLAGPLAEAVGLTATLVAGAILATAAPLLVLLLPAVRNLRASGVTPGLREAIEPRLSLGLAAPPARPPVGAGTTQD